MPVNEKSFFVAPMLELVFNGCPFAVSQIRVYPRSSAVRLSSSCPFAVDLPDLGSGNAELKRILLIEDDLAFSVYKGGAGDGWNY